MTPYEREMIQSMTSQLSGYMSMIGDSASMFVVKKMADQITEKTFINYNKALQIVTSINVDVNTMVECEEDEAVLTEVCDLMTNALIEMTRELFSDGMVDPDIMQNLAKQMNLNLSN